MRYAGWDFTTRFSFPDRKVQVTTEPNVENKQMKLMTNLVLKLKTKRRFTVTWKLSHILVLFITYVVRY